MGDAIRIEARALLALYRNHPDTPPDRRYGKQAHRAAPRKREMLLDWAATQPDETLLDCRNLGAGSLRWIRTQRSTRMPSGDFRPPSTDWQQGYDAGYREAQEDAAIQAPSDPAAPLRDAAELAADRLALVVDDLRAALATPAPVTTCCARCSHDDTGTCRGCGFPAHAIERPEAIPTPSAACIACGHALEAHATVTNDGCMVEECLCEATDGRS